MNVDDIIHTLKNQGLDNERVVLVLLGMVLGAIFTDKNDSHIIEINKHGGVAMSESGETVVATVDETGFFTISNGVKSRTGFLDEILRS